jgi:heptosyltransferase-3
LSGNALKRLRRVLIFRIGQLGDTIIALPALWEIRSQLPAASLCLLSKRNSIKSEIHPRHVLPDRGLIDEWLDYPFGNGSRNSLPFVSLLLKIRHRQFDAMVYLAPRRRSLFQIRRDLVFFRLCGIDHFLAHHGFSPLPQAIPGQPLPMVDHEADHLLSRLALSGFQVPSPGKGRMDLALTHEERERALSWLRRKIPFFDNEATRLVAIGPSSKWPSKVWPETRFTELGTALIRELKVLPIVMGGSEDRGLAERLVKHWSRGVVGAGELSVRDAAAVLEYCRVYIGNDTGTMHLAAAVGVSCVAICSAQDWPGCWYPYGEGHTVIRRYVPCEGCNLQVCTVHGLQCLNLIEVHEVMETCRNILNSPDPVTCLTPIK